MIAVIRPYGTWIRSHILDILQGAGIDVNEPLVLNDPMTATEMVNKIRVLPPKAYLIPYHAVRGVANAAGTKKFRSGVTVIGEFLDLGLAMSAVPIFMPVTQAAKIAFEGELKDLPKPRLDWFKQNVCVLEEPFDNQALHIQAVSTYLQKRK